MDVVIAPQPQYFDPEYFYTEALEANGITFTAGVPDSTLSDLLNMLANQDV